MSQLSNNTTSLQVLLEAVNALPDAGSGEKRIATGTLKGSGGISLSVTGIGFKPSHIVVATIPGSTAQTTVAAFHVAGIDCVIAYGSNNVYSYGSSGVKWDITDGGFTVTNNVINSFLVTFTYTWIAIE